MICSSSTLFCFPSLHSLVFIRLIIFRVQIKKRQAYSPGGGYSHILPIRVCAAQRGRDFEAPDLERGIHFRGVF